MLWVLSANLGVKVNIYVIIVLMLFLRRVSISIVEFLDDKLLRSDDKKLNPEARLKKLMTIHQILKEGSGLKARALEYLVGHFKNCTEFICPC